MSIEDNKALIRRWIEARNSSDLEAALALWVNEMHERLTHAFNQFTQAFPDLHVTIEEMIAEGDKVCVRWMYRATVKGKQAAATGMHLFRITGGKIEEFWINMNEAGA